MDRDVITSEMTAQQVAELLQKLPELESEFKERGRKFVLTEESEMIFSVKGGKDPKHEALGKGKNVTTAGYLKYDIDDSGEVTQINFANTSGDYCPTYKSLIEAVSFITDLQGSLTKTIVIEDNPNPNCPTHVVTEDTPFYETSPQQGRPPDGEFLTGEKVRLIEHDSSYPRVKSKNGNEVYVAAEHLKSIE